MTGLWRGSRLALGIGLVALILVWPAERDTRTVALSSELSVEDVAAALSTQSAQPLLYDDSIPPTRGVATLLSAGARSGRAVTLVTPPGQPMLRVSPPDRATTGRRTALDISVRGNPDSARVVTVTDRAGAVDSIQVRIGPAGVADVAIAVEPTRAGVSGWTVRSGADSLVARVWARPQRPVRVLVRTNVPTWESRYLVRALEAAGASVSVTQDLGRGQRISTPDAPRSLERAALDRSDVVVVFGDQPPPASLRSWVVEGGGGLLLIREPPRAPAVDARRLTWTGPVEIVPLPPVDLPLTGRPVEVGPAGSPIVSVGEEVYAAAEWWGRGRVLTSGLTTWPWALRADHGAEHRRYWESAVEWLAGGLREDDAFLRGPVGQPHVAWVGDLWEAARPSSVQTDPSRHVRRVPTIPGGLAVLESRNAGIVVAPNEEPLPWAEAALEVGRAGGRLVAAGAPLPAVPSAQEASWLPWLRFVALAVLAVFGWAARRIFGHA